MNIHIYIVLAKFVETLNWWLGLFQRNVDVSQKFKVYSTVLFFSETGVLIIHYFDHKLNTFPLYFLERRLTL